MKVPSRSVWIQQSDSNSCFELGLNLMNFSLSPFPGKVLLYRATAVISFWTHTSARKFSLLPNLPTWPSQEVCSPLGGARHIIWVKDSESWRRAGPQIRCVCFCVARVPTSVSWHLKSINKRFKLSDDKHSQRCGGSCSTLGGGSVFYSFSLFRFAVTNCFSTLEG